MSSVDAPVGVNDDDASPPAYENVAHLGVDDRLHRHEDVCIGIGAMPEKRQLDSVELIGSDKNVPKPRSWRFRCQTALIVVPTLFFAGLVMFFLYPRPVVFLKKDYHRVYYPTGVEINNGENPSVYVNYTFDYKMVNPNFYPVKLISLDLEVAMNEVLAKARNSSGLMIPLRSTEDITVDVEIAFKDSLSFMKKFCIDPRSWVHTVFVRTTVVAVVKVLFSNYSAYLVSYQKLSCYNGTEPEKQALL